MSKALYTQLYPIDERSLKVNNECVYENIICRWLEYLADTAAQPSNQSNDDDNSNTAAVSEQGKRRMLEKDGEAFLLIHDFSLLHASAQFSEPSMLAEFFQTQSLPPNPSFHTLWVLSGVADFWAGDSEGEHYSAILMKFHNSKLVSANNFSGNDSAQGVQEREEANGPTPSAPSSPLVPTQQKSPSAGPAAIEAFLFDSSNQKNVVLSSRLVRIITHALTMTPQLKEWYESGVLNNHGASAEDGSKRGCANLWAWNGSPPQQSAVGCGVYMSAHLEQLCLCFTEGSPSRPSLAEFCQAIRTQHHNQPTLTLRLSDGGRPSTANAQNKAAPQQSELSNALEVTNAYLTSYFGIAPEGDRAFEPAYRKYMARKIGI